MSCPYKDSLGIPRQGAHAYRLFDIAVIDVALLIVFAIVLKLIVSYFTPMSYPLAFLIAFLLGVTLHRIFCVRTTIDKWLFP